jgi:hypothetical protein
MPLRLIFEKSFAEGKVSSEWKKATVVPIFKKGSGRETGNYMPVSLTSIPRVHNKGQYDRTPTTVRV